jgi:predicted alpha/beta-fold hydrolase
VTDEFTGPVTFPPTDLPNFTERSPWRGGDLQTIRNVLRRPKVDFSGVDTHTLTFPLADGTGDLLNGELQGSSRSGKPLVVLIHGLTGCFDSEYVRASAAWWLDLGYPVIRVNLRAAGPINRLCREQYFAGRTEDLRALFAALKAEMPASDIVAVGYSLGGNMLLKYLGEEGDGAVPAAAVSVSAPIDLAATSAHFERRRNGIYKYYLLRRMRKMSLALRDLSPAHAAAIAATRSVYEFDDTYIAPRYGFGDAPTYYARNSAAPYLGSIRVPTLVIHADNDPWIPIEPYRRIDWTTNRCLTPFLSRGGGHVGFHGKGSRQAWHDRAAGAFLTALTQ